MTDKFELNPEEAAVVFLALACAADVCTYQHPRGAGIGADLYERLSRWKPMAAAVKEWDKAERGSNNAQHD